MSLRKDTLSHAYELLKVEDPKKRRRLAEQVARGELTLVKLRDKIEGRRRAAEPASRTTTEVDDAARGRADRRAEDGRRCRRPPVRPAADLTRRFAGQRQAAPGRALDELVGVLRTPDAVASIAEVDRANLAKYLTIAKLRLENAIAIVRTGDTGD